MFHKKRVQCKEISQETVKTKFNFLFIRRRLTRCYTHSLFVYRWIWIGLHHRMYWYVLTSMWGTETLAMVRSERSMVSKSQVLETKAAWVLAPLGLSVLVLAGWWTVVFIIAWWWAGSKLYIYYVMSFYLT